MKTLATTIAGLLLTIAGMLGGQKFGAFAPISIPAGGTGTSTPLSYGKVWVGNSAGTALDAVATSTFGGGGGTPGGSDTQVQFNDSGAFGGDGGLTYNKSADRLTVTYASSTILTTNTLYGLQGTAFSVKTPNNNIGTDITIQAGVAVSGDSTGGDVNINAGDGFGSGAGGSFSVNSGFGESSGSGGLISFISGDGGTVSGNGGSVSFEAGSAQGSNSNGGDISFSTGGGFGAGTQGLFTFTGSGSSGLLNFNSILGSDKTFTFPSLTGTFLLTDTLGKTGIGTTSPVSLFTVASTTLATTTIEFGDRYTTNSKTCFNIKNSVGVSMSFYFNDANTMIVEANVCK